MTELDQVNLKCWTAFFKWHLDPDQGEGVKDFVTKEH